MSLFTRLSLANRAIVALLSVLIAALGLAATVSMKQELLPALEQPSAVVVVAKPGFSSATLDQQVVTPLVRALTAVPGVDKVSSSTSNGSAQVSVSWAFGLDSTKVTADVKAAASDALQGGPDGVSTQVFSGSADDIPVLALALTSDEPLNTLADNVQDVLVPAIKKVPGVRDVTIAGLIKQRLLVTADPTALAAHNIDPAVVEALLRTTGALVPAGTSVDGKSAYAIEVGQENSTIADIAALPIPTLDGPVPLSQVAKVELAPVEESSISRADGKPAIGLTITKTPDANAVGVSHAVSDATAAVLAQLGAGATSHVVFDQSTMVEQSIHDLSVEGGLGLLFAVLVILVFLLSPRATVITAISIPMSLLIAIIGLRVGGFSLNILTLAALTVAVGRVVDDSIVVIENITRRKGAEGLTPASVRASVAQVAGAVTASTLTTVAVFLPVAFIGGVAGELFRPFAVTVSVALLASLVVSLTLVPVLAYWFMRKPSAATQLGELEATPVRAAIAGPTSAPQAAERTTRFQRVYLPVLGLALRRPVTMVIVACLAFGGSLVAAGFLKTDLLGGFADARAIQVRMTMPPSATLAAADATAVDLERKVAGVDQVESYQTTVGAEGAPVLVDVVVAKDADPVVALKSIRTAVADLPRADQITVEPQATQAASSTIDVVITGNDEASLSHANDSLVSALRPLDGVKRVTSDLQADKPVLKVVVNQTAAAAQGFSSAEVGAAVAAAVEGQRLGTVSVDGRTLDLVLRSQSTDSSPAAIGALPLPVSALQQQRTQKDGADALTREQDDLSAAARQEASRSATDQLSQLATARQQAASGLAALQQQLANVIANPPVADPTPVTAGDLAAIQYAQLVAQLQDAVSGSQSSLVSLDQQLGQLRKSIADGDAQQAKLDALAQKQRDLTALRAHPVLVRDLATVSVVNAPATITRIDGVRAITVSVLPEGGDLGAVSAAITAAVDGVTLPSGVTIEQGGAAAEQDDSFAQLGLAMIIAIALVYIVLVATFRSLVQPVLLLVSVPLAATGAIVGLIVTGTPLGIPALIGMLMLIGIVVTNAIVLIDLINEYRRNGAAIDDAVTHGARLRLRPIIMTACATVFALLPMALGLTGGGAFISQSLAIVVIGGLVSSTLLTLLVLPALYVLRERAVDRRAAKRRARYDEGVRPAIAADASVAAVRD